MQDGRKAVWSNPYVSVAFFSSLKHNFIAYRYSKPEIIKIGQSSYKIYSNFQEFQESTTILNACTKKFGNLLNAPRMNHVILPVTA